MSTTRTIARAALVAALLVGLPTARAQEPTPPKDAPKEDEAIDKLLQKIENPNQPPQSVPTPAKDKAKDSRKADDPDKAKAPEKKPTPPADKARGTVAPKDQDVDDLLGKIGETAPKPETTDDKSPGGPTPPEPMPTPGPEAKGADPLKGDEKKLDEHLEDLLGRKRKKDKDKERDAEDGGPLSDVIKQMRDVEQRLGEPDTGEETRQRQVQIVKRIDTLIEQMRQSRGQMQMRRVRSEQQGPQRPGDQPGQNPGSMAGGAPNQRPARPDGRAVNGRDKDIWGHLDTQLREEMGNIFKEEPLPIREDLIKRYYMAVSKKSLARGE